MKKTKTQILNYLIVLAIFFAPGGFSFAQTLRQSNVSAASFQQKYQEALNAERRNQPEIAIERYRDLLEIQPNNSGIRHRLKSIYISQQMWSELEQMLTDWALREPSNINAAIELGWVKTHTGKTAQAKKIWRELLQTSRQKEQLARSIFFTSASYPGELDGEAIIAFLRAELNDSLLLSADYIPWLIDRQHWESAFNEISAHLEKGAFPIAIVKSRLFRLPADNPLTNKLIQYLTDDEKSATAARLAADLLYHANRADELAAFASLRISDLSPEQIHTFAKGLHQQKQYGASEIICKAALESVGDPALLSQLLYLLAANYEQQFREALPRPQLIPQPYQSELTRIDFFPYSTEEAELIYRAVSLYDSLASLYDNLAQDARFRIGEIRFNIFNDFDQARQDFQKAADAKAGDTRLQAIKRLIDVEIAIGNRSKAQETLQKAPEKYRLSVAEEDALMLKQIQLNYLFRETDSLAKNINTALALLGESHLLYNDLLNFAALNKGILADTINAPLFLQGENELHQNRLSRAKERFLALLQPANPLYKIAAMRYLDILRSLGEIEEEEAFWNSHYTGLTDGVHSDYFTIKYGEYLEYLKSDIPGAIERYTDFLLAFPQSSYYETVRLHTRQLIALQSGRPAD
jgi:hypothetical protein